MVNVYVTLVVILSITNKPPKILCIVYSCDGKSIGTRRIIGSRCLYSRGGGKSDSRADDEQAQHYEPFPPLIGSPVICLHIIRRIRYSIIADSYLFSLILVLLFCYT